MDVQNLQGGKGECLPVCIYKKPGSKIKINGPYINHYTDLCLM